MRAELPRMTVEEFYAWNERQPIPHELVQGRAVPLYLEPDGYRGLRGMSAGSADHHELIAAVARVIDQWRPRECRVLAGGPALRTGDDTVREPDLLLSCGPRTRGMREPPNPVLIVEILSPTTNSVDRLDKVPEYRALVQVQEIWLVDSTRRAVTVYARHVDGYWIDRDIIGSGTFPSAVLAAEISLDDIYEGLPL